VLAEAFERLQPQDEVLPEVDKAWRTCAARFRDGLEARWQRSPQTSDGQAALRVLLKYWPEKFATDANVRAHALYRFEGSEKWSNKGDAARDLLGVGELDEKYVEVALHDNPAMSAEALGKRLAAGPSRAVDEFLSAATQSTTLPVSPKSVLQKAITLSKAGMRDPRILALFERCMTAWDPLDRPLRQELLAWHKTEPERVEMLLEGAEKRGLLPDWIVRGFPHWKAALERRRERTGDPTPASHS
jgi:hypothetical protein